jgi:ABC-type Fe3+-hydroxamate transport system substrate-binding protein
MLQGPRRLCFLIVVASTFGLYAASPSVDGSPERSNSVRQTATARATTDETGRRVEIPAVVKRVVTLSPDLTETVYALGLEDRLAGDTNYCETPPAATLKPHIGEPLNPSLEAIVALHPDLVLASTSINRRQTVEALARLGIAVYTSNPHTVQGMLDSVARIAEIMGSATQGRALVSRLGARLERLHAQVADLPLAHVLFVVWEDPLITIGQNTFIADALQRAGAESVILSDQNWPQIELEEVVRLQPDYIVFTSKPMAGSSAHLTDLRSKAAWSGLRAVELGQVISVSDEIARPSPGLVDAIEELAQKVHPEAFSEHSPSDRHNPGGGTQDSQLFPGPEECSACAR